MPMLRWYAGTGLTSSPLMRTSPASWRRSPAIIKRHVVLPQPEGPRRVSISPLLIDRDTSRTAATVPKYLATARSSTDEMTLTPPIRARLRAQNWHQNPPNWHPHNPALRLKLTAPPPDSKCLSKGIAYWLRNASRAE